MPSPGGTWVLRKASSSPSALQWFGPFYRDTCFRARRAARAVLTVPTRNSAYRASFIVVRRASSYRIHGTETYELVSEDFAQEEDKNGIGHSAASDGGESCPFCADGKAARKIKNQQQKKSATAAGATKRMKATMHHFPKFYDLDAFPLPF